MTDAVLLLEEEGQMFLFDKVEHQAKLRTKVEDTTQLGINVYEAACLRFSALWDEYDEVVVSWSGGKDSTILLEIARETCPSDRKVTVLFYDEELIPHDTVSYAEAVCDYTNVDFWWVCAPMNRCDDTQKDGSVWSPWDPARGWHRQPPPDAIIEWPDGIEEAKNMDHVSHMLFQDRCSDPVLTIGIRTEESHLRRYHRCRRGPKGWVWKASTHPKHRSWPIYDWRLGDVWKYIADSGCPYNAYYDKMMFSEAGTGKRLRLAPPGGSYTAKTLDAYRTTYPELYDAISDVMNPHMLADWVKQGIHRLVPRPAPGVSWHDHVFNIIGDDPISARNMRWELRRHIRDAQACEHDPPHSPLLAVDSIHPDSGRSWGNLTKIAQEGFRRPRQSMYQMHRNGTLKSTIRRRRQYEFEVGRMSVEEQELCRVPDKYAEYYEEAADA